MKTESLISLHLGWNAILVFVLIVLGGVVQVGGESFACAGWPLCDGAVVPSVSAANLFDVLHRLLSVGLLVYLGWLALFRGQAGHPRARRVVWLALGLVIVQAGLGAWMVFQPLAWVSTLHLAFTLSLLAILCNAWVVERMRTANELHEFQLDTKFKRMASITALAIFTVLVIGGAVASTDAASACAGWPLCGGQLLPGHWHGWLNLAHRLSVGIAALIVLALLLRAWRVLRGQTGALVSATLVGMLYLAQMQLGALQVVRGFPLDLLWLHQASAAALWVSAILLVSFVAHSGVTQAEEDAQRASEIGFAQRVKDLVALSKPIIVVLLLVTTYTGMVVGAKAIPGLEVTAWTLIGGALAAGGSGAINQYIDREIDRRMARTAKRPIASGRMTPAEGIAFGVGVLVVAFFMMAGFVNLLAALLSLAGMLYYVVLYSLVLKHRSVQNIVIGGGAGAIPPLVGWAAVTGTLSIPAWFLFLIIFMWTPPHFWALALVRTNDYKEAGIPMLPVVKGRDETKRQVWLYTLVLVGTTLLMWVFDFAGWLYLGSAIVLGLILIYWAWRVLRDGSNKIAWRMYRYSSMYLALLFVALMVDAVVLH